MNTRKSETAHAVEPGLGEKTDSESKASGFPREIAVTQGNLYLSCELCETYLRGSNAVALLAREQNILILPLTPQSGGGLLLKQRNVRGDRVIHAQEFFREKGFLEDFEKRTLPVQWSSEAAALIVIGVPQIRASA